MDASLKKIKISFSVFILLLVVGMAGGSFAVKDSNFYIKERVSQTVSYLNYRSSFTYATNNKNLTASVASIFNNSLTVENNNNIAKSVPVLLYHGIINDPDGANVLLENFKNQMFALKKAGWQTVSIEDFYAFMQGNKELPDKSFLLTFDDGRKDSYYPVDPILRALDYNAVMFAITKYSLEDKSGNYYLSKKELQRMAKNGRWEIEAHTREGHDMQKISSDGELGHFYSNKLWLDSENRLETEEEFISRIKSDFTVAKNDIEQTLGTKVISFAFPFGDFGQNSINFPESENIIMRNISSIYDVSFYQVWAGKGHRFNYLDKKTFLMKRIEVDSIWLGQDLLDNLEIGRDKLMPYKDNFSKDSGWQKDWGRMGVKDGSMIIGAHASTTGSAVFLDGAYLWRDYKFKANVNLTKGQTFSLIARYKDGKNYTTCSYSDKSIKIEQILNGERKILSELKGDFVFIGKNRKVGIEVYGDIVNCYLDDKIAIKGYDLDQELDYGGIGFKTWDPQINNSELIVKNVSVEEIK